jgi:hypothetical protein
MLSWLIFCWMCLQHVKENVTARRIVEIAQFVVLLLFLLALLGVFK